MRLEPTHKPIVGVNAASLVSVPTALLLFVLSFRAAPPPQTPAPQPAPASTGVPPAAVSLPAPRPPEAAHALPDRRQPAAVTANRKAIASKVVYSVRWPGGMSRRKVVGNLPQYPPEVTSEALVRLELVVSGSGNVRSAKLLQTGNAQCDDAALREVRQWKFEALPRQASRDQRCTVLVSFMKK